MKKIVSLLCAALCLTLLLAACGAKVPEGMEEEKVKAAAEATVKQLDARDYEALMDTMDDTLKGAMTAEEWAATWQPAADQLGALVEICLLYTSVTTRGMAEADMDVIAGCIADCITDFAANKEDVASRVAALIARYPLYE